MFPGEQRPVERIKVGILRQLAIDLLQAGADLVGHCRHTPRLEIQIVADLKPVILESSLQLIQIDRHYALQHVHLPTHGKHGIRPLQRASFGALPAGRGLVCATIPGTAPPLH
ncbi:MAG: hypothetical protein ACRDIE_24015 [Chloroflexota bacterium]